MRYVVLHHTGWPGHADHYDLMLQMRDGRSDEDAVLKTFATADDVFPWPGGKATLQLISDHRRAYLDLEGPLSGQRGVVRRADAGELLLLDKIPALDGDIRVGLYGRRLQGQFRLRKLHDAAYAFETLAAHGA